MPPSASTTTAVDTFGAGHKTKPSRGQASTSRPSMTRGTRAVPQLTQKCPTQMDCTGRTSLRLRGRRVLLLCLLERRLHVGDPDLVAAALLGCVEGLVGPLHHARDQSRLGL